MMYNIVDNALYYIKDNNIMDLKERQISYLFS